MGKRLIVQKRGRGTPAYVTPKHKFDFDAKYIPYDEVQREGKIRGTVVDLVDDTARSAITMQIKFDNGVVCNTVAPEGIAVGDIVEFGADAEIKIGNVLPLEKIPEGTPIFNIENNPGDGGQIAKASGAYAQIITKTAQGVYIKLPSKKKILFKNSCRATIGNAAGGGRTEKPLVKAGTNYYKHKAKNKHWPIVRGVAMNPVNHKHGGKEHHVGKATTVSRHARPGQKVGHIAAKRTGRKKK